MDGFVNRYAGYSVDLQNLIFELGRSEDIGRFKQYMENKSRDMSNAEKAAAADALLDYFKNLSTLRSKMDGFLEMVEQLQSYEDLSLELDEDDVNFLERAKELEDELFKGIDSLKGIGNAMTRYNEADGYGELKSNEQLQEMYQAVETITSIPAQKSLIDRKAVQTGLRGRVITNWYRSGNLLNRIKNLNKQAEDMTPSRLDNRISNEKKEIAKLQSQVNSLKDKKTERFYENAYNQALKEKQEHDKMLADLKDKIEVNKNAIRMEEFDIKNLEGVLKEEQDYLNQISIYEKKALEQEKVYNAAKKERVGEEEKLAATDDSLKNLSGDPKMVRAYYDRKMTYEKWKRAYEGFESFLETYREDVEVMGVIFHSSGKSMEKILSTNEKFKDKFRQSRSKLGEIIHWCPIKDLLPGSTEGNVKDYCDGLRLRLKQEMDKAENEYLTDQSYVITRSINHLNNQQNELSAEKTEESLVIGAELDKFIESRNEGKLANTNDVDQIIAIKLEGEEKISRARMAEEAAKAELENSKSCVELYKDDIYKLRHDNCLTYSLDIRQLEKEYREGRYKKEEYLQRLQAMEEKMLEMSVADILKSRKEDLKNRMFLAEETYPKAKEELDKKISINQDNMRGYSKKALEGEIRDAEEKLRIEENKLNDDEEMKKEMDGIYSEYREVTKDRNDIYKTYKDTEFSRDYFDSIRQRTQSFLDGFGYAKKRASYKNSDEYDAIKIALNSLSAVQNNIGEIVAAIGVLKRAAETYLRAKNKQFRLFPSRQRIYRINFATSIRKFCDTQRMLLTEEGFDAGDDAHEFMKIAGNLSNSGRDRALEKDEFFKEYSKEFATKDKRQEKVNADRYNLNLHKEIKDVEMKKESQQDIDKEKHLGTFYLYENQIYGN